MAHRVAYEWLVGPIPVGLDLGHVCHDQDASCPGGLCMHRRCVNPAHLRPMTRAENCANGRHNASRTHCPRGHAYDEANTYVTPSGYRQCRTCNRERAAGRRGHLLMEDPWS